MTDSSLVYTTNFEVGANGPQNFIDKLKDVFNYAGTHYWKLDDSTDGSTINATNLYALLKTEQQTWTTNQAPADWGLEDPNDQQILIEATTGTPQYVYVTYFPKGGVTTGNYQTDFAAGNTPVLNSGRRRVMYNANYDLDSGANTFFSGQFWIAEHRDINVLHPFSSLTLMFNTGQYSSTSPSNTTNFGQSWSVGFHAGRIMSPAEWNDRMIPDLNSPLPAPDTNHASPGAAELTGDGVLAGVPEVYSDSSAAGSVAYWFDSSTDILSFRYGNEWVRCSFEFTEEQDNLPKLVRANDWARLVPVKVTEFGTANFGYTKYLRFYLNAFSSTPTIFESNNPSSQQAWAGWRNFFYNTAGLGGPDNLCVLWNKSYTVVP